MKIFEVVYQIQATDEQISEILNTMSHVERNLKEAPRLLESDLIYINNMLYYYYFIILSKRNHYIYNVVHQGFQSFLR